MMDYTTNHKDLATQLFLATLGLGIPDSDKQRNPVETRQTVQKIIQRRFELSESTITAALFYYIKRN